MKKQPKTPVRARTARALTLNFGSNLSPFSELDGSADFDLQRFYRVVGSRDEPFVRE
jgi:hypothetical protein